MKKKQISKRINKVPENAVLLIPEPESEHEPAAYGIKPGYYDSKQMLQLIDQNKRNADAIQFIADMLESGDAESDGFAKMLRTRRSDPVAIARIVLICRENTKV